MRYLIICFFPGHEQHHNNSFLIASVVKGQSNIAAGATIGSNHNSRSNDGEIEAGRGFWPGLCTSIKHSSKFASYTILSKADYPSEIINPFPFALLCNNTAKDELHVMPAFTWMYNMYSMARNTHKYSTRDARIFKIQNIEFDSFAPDSMEEALYARILLERWTAKSYLKSKGKDSINNTELSSMGRKLLNGDRKDVDKLEIFGENMEKGKRNVRILKVYDAYHAYGDMIIYYAIKNMVAYLNENPDETFQSMAAKIDAPHESDWINLGGQIMLASDFDNLRNDIKNESINSWKEIHKRYNDIWKKYPADKLCHAFSSLKMIIGEEPLSSDGWIDLLNKGIEIQNFIMDQVFQSRKKDYDNIYRHVTCRNDEEFQAAFGPLEENGFIEYTLNDTKRFIERIQELKKRVEF